VVSLDCPSGLNATTGEHSDCVLADFTLSFGGAKRGTLLARDVCGEIAVLDIGLPDSPSLPLLIDGGWVSSRLPPIAYDSHKGVRKHLAIVGGGTGMAGAAVLATRAALRSGIGLVRTAVSRDNTAALASATPSALISEWPLKPAAASAEIGEWADAIVVGPGLGQSTATRALVERVLEASRCPALLDADALNLFAGSAAELRDLLAGRATLITPHVAEFARLAKTDVKTVLAERFDVGVSLAAELGVTILLKGTPTIIFSADGNRLVAARGTAALATGGSGDLLAGIAGTLLAQTGDTIIAAGCTAWVHGRAAELCGYVRGTTLEDVLYALPRAWNEEEQPHEPPVIARLPAVSS
jgi:NAD(P)H-hydrate epimerase